MSLFARRNSNRDARVIQLPLDPRRPLNQPLPRKVFAPDRIGLVGFHDAAFVIAYPDLAHSAKLLDRSQSLHGRVGGSGTNITDGLRKAADMLSDVSKGILRRIWLLTDGYPNRETDAIMSVVQRCQRSYINVNTIGFGNSYDEGLLRQISSATHNGQFVPIRSLRELSMALTKGSDSRSNEGQRRVHRAETTVLAIDLSPSMTEPMEGKTKVQVVQEAVLHLLNYKQRCFS